MNPETTAQDLPLPPSELRLMPNDTDERFVKTGVDLATMLYRFGLQDDHALLDVGCSCGRLPIGLLSGTDFHGRYRGFDVMKKQVQWARRNLGPLREEFTFAHLDVVNDRYNPRGTIKPEEVRFPCRDQRFDFACLFSIFTHFYKEDIQLYLHELHRVLRPGGTVLATWFVYDEERLPKAVGSRHYPMVHRLDEVTIYSEEVDPLRAIAFDEAHVRKMVETAGLEVVEIERGRWAGEPGREFQDVVLLRRPAETTNLGGRLRRAARAARARGANQT